MAGFETAPPDLKPLLAQRINELGLKLEGSPLERYVADLYQELEAKGLSASALPRYLTDEWGCPYEEPIIGIPFYLADPKLARLEKRDRRHRRRSRNLHVPAPRGGPRLQLRLQALRDAGVARAVRPVPPPLPRRYKPVPFSRSFVRHMEGWYAQKHPDEDFAETFAVWLTPRSRWRERYRGWRAMRQAALRRSHRPTSLGDAEPVVAPRLDRHHGRGDEHDRRGILSRARAGA